MPLRLVVSMIVGGLTIPAIVTGLSALEADQVALQVEREIGRIVRAAQEFYVSGGGAEVISIELSGGLTAPLEYVRIGDSEGGPLAPSAVYRISGHPEIFLLSNPRVPMAGKSGPLILSAGLSAVRVSYEGAGPVRLAVA